jgi:chromosome segregation ATPase
MSLFAKIMVVVNFILAVAFLAAAGTLLGAAEDYKGKYEKALADATTERTDLQAQVTAAGKRGDEAQSRFTESEKSLATASAQLKQLSASNDQLSEANRQIRANMDKLAEAQKDLQGKNSEQSATIDKLRGELSTSEAARKEALARGDQLAESLARETQDKETAEKALAAAETAQKDMAETLDSQKTTIERYKREKGDLTGAVSMKDVDGVIQAADNKVDIYILSVGQKDGVEVGYEFTVYRGSDYVATVVVDKVFANHASATTKAGTKRRDINPGDEASTRL